MTGPLRSAGGFGLLGVLLALGSGPQGLGRAAAAEDPTLGALVARTFLQAVTDGDVDTALPLCADEVDFDGTVRKGRLAVRAALLAMKQRMGGHRAVRFVTVLSFEEARRRFGPPPERLHLPGPARGMQVGFARFGRLGLVVFVAPVQGRYRVVALTD